MTVLGEVRGRVAWLDVWTLDGWVLWWEDHTAVEIR